MARADTARCTPAFFDFVLTWWRNTPPSSSRPIMFVHGFVTRSFQQAEPRFTPWGRGSTLRASRWTRRGADMRRLPTSIPLVLGTIALVTPVFVHPSSAVAATQAVATSTSSTSTSLSHHHHDDNLEQLHDDNLEHHDDDNVGHHHHRCGHHDHWCDHHDGNARRRHHTRRGRFYRLLLSARRHRCGRAAAMARLSGWAAGDRSHPRAPANRSDPGGGTYEHSVRQRWPPGSQRLTPDGAHPGSIQR